MHVILGAGAVGSAVATQLAARGEQVRILSRRGSGPEHRAVERVAADATDTARLNALTTGATVLYNCANPEYHRWLTDWPPIAAALLTAAERSGAVLAATSNLYGYGPVTGPITPETPLAATHPKLHLRAQMWRDALALHGAGRIRATEVRGGDYLEANSIFTYLTGPVRAGKRVQSPVPVDVPHSWTSITDVARTLIAAAGDERGWGQAWLVPSNAPMTVRELTNRFATVVDAPEPTISAVPYPVLWTMGVFNTMARELRTTLYQFEKPFVLDASLTERTFGLAPSDLDEALRVA